MPAFTFTSSAKFDPTKLSAPPRFVIAITIISLLIVIPMIILSVVNYGVLCIWLNSTVAALILLYHSVFLIVVFIYRKSFSSAITPVDEEQNKALEDESLDGLEKTPSKPPSIAYNFWSLVTLSFLFIVNGIAFCIMFDVTVLGVERGTLPTERLEWQKWNTKIQIAQTGVLGSQLLTIGTLLVVSAWGRRRIILEEEKHSEEERYII